MNLEVTESSSTGMIDSNTMTVLESMVPTEGQPPHPMVIYVQSNLQNGDQVLSFSEEMQASFPDVDPFENIFAPNEQIIALVDDLGQALGEGQAVPVTLSDIGNIDYVENGSTLQTEDGHVLYLTYTVDNGSGDGNLHNSVTLQPLNDVEMLTEIPSSQPQQQIVLQLGAGEGNYMMGGGLSSVSSILPDNSNMTLRSIPDSKKSGNGKKQASAPKKRNEVDHRKTTRVICPEVHIEEKLQVLEVIVPRIERPKKKKPETKSEKQKSSANQEKAETSKKEDGENVSNPTAGDQDKESKKDEKDGEKEDGLYMCDLCGNAYSRAAQYYGHLHTHSGERDWNCHLCGEVFKSHSQLRRHESRSHLNLRPYPCSICGCRFDRASQLRYHERRIHAGERPHRCLICSKGFFKRSDLRTHVNIHLGINKSICETCGKQFNHVSNLIRHIRIHTGIKPYPCNVCGRRFSQVNALQHHKESHNTNREFKCLSCNKKFKSNFMLKKHMKAQHADSPSLNQEEEVKFMGQFRRYYCNVCGEDFPFSAMLKDHESKHKKESNFHCNCCGNNYLSADEFKVHSCFDTEDSKNNRRDEGSNKKDMVNSYSELLNRFTKEVAEDARDEVMYHSQSEVQNECTIANASQQGGEIEQGLSRAHALILGMEQCTSDDIEVVEEKVKLPTYVNENEVELIKGSNRSEENDLVKDIHSSNAETNWDGDSDYISKGGKLDPGNSHEESEIVIYVTPGVTHNGEMPGTVQKIENTTVFIKDEEHENIQDQKRANTSSQGIILPKLSSDNSTIVLTGHLTENPPEKDVVHVIETLVNSSAPVTNNIPANTDVMQSPKEKIKSPAKTFKCKECGKVFSKSSNYKQHLGIHFVDLQHYQCKLCGQSFAWKSTLNKHMTNSHQTGPAPKYSCGYCTKEYTTKSQVQEHIKRDHFKERPHTCTECDKTFYKKYDLKIHLRTHTKEKPYICGSCGKAFYHLSHIIRHERIHTGERPYKCDDCGREFNQSSTLKTHKIRHSNCAASLNKLEAKSKTLITELANMRDKPRKSRTKKVDETGQMNPIDLDFLHTKDNNLSFENIPSSFEENVIPS